MFLDKWFSKKKAFGTRLDSAVFTCCHVLEERVPILYVEHDSDGDWQFLCGKEHTTDEARIVSVKEVIKIDSSICFIDNLTCGQIAERKSGNDRWKIKERLD